MDIGPAHLLRTTPADLADALGQLTAERQSLVRAEFAEGPAPGWPASRILGALDLAVRALADKDAEIARLQAELDAASDVPVEYVIEAGLAAAMAADPHREDGAVIRCTDGEREAWAWRTARGEWEQVR